MALGPSHRWTHRYLPEVPPQGRISSKELLLCWLTSSPRRGRPGLSTLGSAVSKLLRAHLRRNPIRLRLRLLGAGQTSPSALRRAGRRAAGRENCERDPRGNSYLSAAACRGMQQPMLPVIQEGNPLTSVLAAPLKSLSFTTSSNQGHPTSLHRRSGRLLSPLRQDSPHPRAPHYTSAEDTTRQPVPEPADPPCAGCAGTRHPT